MERYEGTPQGGPLSPLLANVLLDEVDKELEKRGHTFCRYADDSVPRGCTRDGGRPPEAGLQEQASNHHKLQGSRAPVVSVVGKGRKKTDQVRTKETSASEPLLTCRKRRDGVKTGCESLTREESGGDLLTAQAASGIKAA
jgi:RNA-directed DNA polymerase